VSIVGLTRHQLKGNLKNVVGLKDIISAQSIYKKSLSEIEFVPNSKKLKLGVVIHLFYIESWNYFEKKLQALREVPFDLFITIPKQNVHFIDEIKKTYPNANIIVVPNRGRDVLPFIKVAKKLYEAGYEYILKFHSKKSTHRDDGQSWLEDMIEKLLPDDLSIIKSMHEKLQDKNTGIIGPKGVYYPLTVNFPANGAHMMYIIRKLYSNLEAQEYLQIKRSEYGFFGGTMFWARLDAIKDLLDFPVQYFEVETGQIDGTFAHALERLFAIVPEIDKKINYEVSDKGVIERPYKSTNIPQWSKDHLK